MERAAFYRNRLRYGPVSAWDEHRLRQRASWAAAVTTLLWRVVVSHALCAERLQRTLGMVLGIEKFWVFEWCGKRDLNPQGLAPGRS
jgi:hypothetical protein